MERSFLHRELTDSIIGVFCDVYNELGFGFLESVYEEAMLIALCQRGLTVDRQVGIPVWFRGQAIGTYEADLVVERVVIIELKAVKQLADVHLAQLMHYLRATEMEVGLLMNFGPTPESKRRIFENSRKTPGKPETDMLANLFT